MIHVELHTETASPLSAKAIHTVVAEAAKLEKKVRGSIEINIVENRTIRMLNKQYRGLNKPTDVLSFAWHEETSVPSTMLGQIYVSPEYIRKQSDRFNVTFKEEFVRMLTHGILHIVGYDHMQPNDAKKMFPLQEKIVQKALTKV